ncbi:hypothetical protein MHYP_G00084580 [Metynnis hypsauchen]
MLFVTESAGSGVCQPFITLALQIWTTLINLFSCPTGDAVKPPEQETEPAESQSSVQPFYSFTQQPNWALQDSNCANVSLFS